MALCRVSRLRGLGRNGAAESGFILQSLPVPGGVGGRLPKPLDRRERNREYDARRRNDRPWRGWYSTARWRAVRLAQLTREPLCWLCAKRGKATPAIVCNHAARHNGDPVKFWSGPFNSMCADCHDTDQQRIERGGKARRGVGADGWPLDP